MLSEPERCTFREIERRLVGEDPRFAASMRRLLSGRTEWWVCLGYELIIVVAALTAVLCLGLAAGGPALVAIALAGATFQLRARRGPWPIARRGGRAGARSRKMAG